MKNDIIELTAEINHVTRENAALRSVIADLQLRASAAIAASNTSHQAFIDMFVVCNKARFVK